MTSEAWPRQALLLFLVVTVCIPLPPLHAVDLRADQRSSSSSSIDSDDIINNKQPLQQQQPNSNTIPTTTQRSILLNHRDTLLRDAAAAGGSRILSTTNEHDNDNEDANNNINQIINNNSNRGRIRGVPCPERCYCYYQTYPGLLKSGQLLLTVNCSGVGLRRYPSGLPNDTEYLDMSNNKLMNLTSLLRLPRLRVLDLSDNWIRQLDNRWIFEHVEKLQVLRLANNELRSIQHGTFSGLHLLDQLDLSGNLIRIIQLHAFGGLRNLKTLRLSQNELFHVERESFLALTSLMELDLAQNYLSTLEDNLVDKLKDIQVLDLSKNALREVPDDSLSGLSSLKVLNLSGNARLEHVPREALQHLDGLDILLLDGIALTRLPTFGMSNIKVKELSISFMPHLRVLEKASFYNLNELRTLQIHDCPRLRFIHPYAFSFVPALRHLLLHNNNLIVIPGQIIQALPSIRDLHIYHNPLRCDCNIFWLRKALSSTSSGRRNNKHTLLSRGGKAAAAASSSKTTRAQPVTSESTSTTTSTTSSDSNDVIAEDQQQKPISVGEGVIREPDRIACFFPDDKSSMPLVQLPLQYFPPTCPPSALPLFSPTTNVTLGEDVLLECHGIGVPLPSVSWILPGQREINASSPTIVGSDHLSEAIELTEETMLRVKAVQLNDSGTYGCRASNNLGQEYSSTFLHVQNKPLDLQKLEVSNDHITVTWKGSIPRHQMKDFQLYYRDVEGLRRDRIENTRVSFGEEGREGKEEEEREEEQERERGKDDLEHLKGGRRGRGGLEFSSRYSVIYLHGSIHKCTITGLKPKTTYEICLVYKQTHMVLCHQWTTLRAAMRVVHSRSSGIVSVSKARVVLAAVVVVVVPMLVVAAVVLIRKRRHRSDYQDPLNDEEKSSIPLEGLLPISPNPSLNSSRTALLTNSHV